MHSSVALSPARSPTTFRCISQRAEPEEPNLGIYYYNARWYDPALGRFLSPDSIVPEPGNPLDWDRYAYVRNNPIKYTDPTGHMVACDKDDWACQTHWDYPVTTNNNEHTLDLGLSEEDVETINNIVEIVAPIIFEPVDWMMMLEDCSNGDCSPWMLVGLLPGIPGSTGKKVGTIVQILGTPKIQKHHIFPQQFEKQFHRIGIKIHQYTVQLSERVHLKGVHGKGGIVGPGGNLMPQEKYNDLWAEFFRNNPNPTQKEVFQFASQLMNTFGICGLPIVPYR